MQRRGVAIVSLAWFVGTVAQAVPSGLQQGGVPRAAQRGAYEVRSLGREWISWSRDVRAERVVLDPGALPRPGDDPRRSPDLFLTLPDGRPLRAVPDRVDVAYGGGAVASYALADDPDGSAAFSVVGDAVTASIHHRGRLYKLAPTGDGAHWLFEDGGAGEDACPTVHRAHTPERADQEGAANAPEPTPEATAGSVYPTLDVLVAYTEIAEAVVGGAEAMQSLVNLAVFETNEGYARSDALGRVNLVGLICTAYAEDGDLTALVDRLQDPADGYMDEVPAYRTLIGADIVELIFGLPHGGAGKAYDIMCPTNMPTFSASAYCAARYTAATGNFTFGHEIGHLLGCHHNTEAAGSPSCAYGGAYGFITSMSMPAYRSIMAYDSYGNAATRVNHYSHPGKIAPDLLPLGTGAAYNANVLLLTQGVADFWGSERNVGHTIATGFGGARSLGGVLFDVQVHSDLSIEGLSVNTNTPVGAAVDLTVFVHPGGYSGYEQETFEWVEEPYEWIPIGSGRGTSNGPGTPTYVALDTVLPVTLETAKTYGVFVRLDSYAPGSAELLSTKSSASHTFRDNHATILVPGAGKTENDLASATVSNVWWDGILHYRGGDGEHRMQTGPESGSSQAHGTMFNVAVTETLVLHSLDVNVASTDFVTVDVWYRPDGYQGSETKPWNWTYLGSDFKSLESNASSSTRIMLTPLPNAMPSGPITLSPGIEYGFYVYVSSAPSNPLQKTLISLSSSSYSDSYLTVKDGISLSHGTFTGTVHADRTMDGALNYSIPGPYLTVTRGTSPGTVDVALTSTTGGGTAVLGVGASGYGPFVTRYGPLFVAPRAYFVVFPVNAGGVGSLTLPVKGLGSGSPYHSLLEGRRWYDVRFFPGGHPDEASNPVSLYVR